MPYKRTKCFLSRISSFIGKLRKKRRFLLVCAVGVADGKGTKKGLLQRESLFVFLKN